MSVSVICVLPMAIIVSLVRYDYLLYIYFDHEMTSHNVHSTEASSSTHVDFYSSKVSRPTLRSRLVVPAFQKKTHTFHHFLLEALICPDEKSTA